MIEAYPLYWPDGWKRTPVHRRTAHQQFKNTFAKYRDDLMREVGRLGGQKPILSTNVALRNDGLPYATQSEPSDPGVALYFKYKGKDMCFAADQFRYCRQNMRAIDLTIKAIRAIERYGASDMMERAFRGFTAIPEFTGEPWRTVFGFSATETVDADVVDSAFRKLAMTDHPDHGGTNEAFQRILNARNDARRALGLTS